MIEDLRALVAYSENWLVLVLHALNCLDHLHVVVQWIDTHLTALSYELAWSLGVTGHSFALIYLVHHVQLIHNPRVLNTLVLTRRLAVRHVVSLIVAVSRSCMMSSIVA